MSREYTYALEAAKEITVAHASHVNLTMSEESGKMVANYYEAVFQKILELAKQNDH